MAPGAKWTLIILVVVQISVLKSAVSSRETQTSLEKELWRSLPKLYDYDDYDECKHRNPDYFYCVVKAHIIENASSELWRKISHYSSDPRHYRRDILELGVCLDQCDTIATEDLGDLTGRMKKCSENRVWNLCQLNSTSEILNCVSKKKLDPPSDSIDDVFSWVTLGLLSLVIMSTIFDAKQLPFKDTLIIRSFSLAQNLKKLGSLNARSRQDLLFLDGARVLTMLAILLCHASIPMIRIPLKNPEQFEQQFESWWFPIAMAGNTYTVQLFFVIGGVVLAVNFLDHIKTHPQFQLTYLLDRIVNRLIRIVPVYAFVILFQASWYRSLKDGPIADRYKDHCTENWWTNLLFVNNYINTSEPCSQFTWYLGADFQLFLVGTSIMMVLWKFPQLLNKLITVMVAFALIVPAAFIYIYNLDATVMMIVRFVTEEIRTLEYYLRVYVTFESNAGNYFFGMIVGIVYHRLSEKAKKMQDLKGFKLMFLSATVFFLAMNGLTALLPRDQLPERSLLLAVFGSLLKCSWGLLVSCLMLYLALSPGCLFGSFLQHPSMLVASKLSYCVYVVQYTVVYGIYRNVTTPLMNGGFNTVLFTSAVLFVAVFAGLWLHLCVEVPCMTLLKPMLERISPKTHQKIQKKQLSEKGETVAKEPTDF
ncbi:O-acyltransferase like protein-like [Culex quinquefasciatus]|uniref:O-acyltransferase like protein-like n=1 Tax=Culex quinquefasciatus TaxID=7176 RepID=UPI0018E3280F|nr:O-acyltransferase like protein-like [Culex quinquefasciatus]